MDFIFILAGLHQVFYTCSHQQNLGRAEFCKWPSVREAAGIDSCFSDALGPYGKKGVVLPIFSDFSLIQQYGRQSSAVGIRLCDAQQQ